MSQLALDLIHEAKRNRAKTLDLGNCSLTVLPDALFDLVDLEVLCLCTEGLYFDFEKNEEIRFESQNKGEHNNIKYLSPKTSQLKNLKVLLANGSYNNKWELSDLSPLKDLVQLQQLDVSYTSLSDNSIFKRLGLSNKSVLSPLKDLVQLQQLDVSSTQVSDLSPLKDLVQLQQLEVFHTKVSDLSPLKDLVQLQQLEVSHTKVSDLSPLKKIIEKGVPVKWAKYKNGIMVEGCPLSISTN